jgi:hypothetical protein
VKELSETITALEEAKTLQRYGVWQLLPTKYAEIRKSLLIIKGSAHELTAAHRKTLQSTIQTSVGIDDEIEVALSTKTQPADVARLNRALSAHIIELHNILVYMRNKVGGP